MERFEERADEQVLAQYPEKNRPETIKLVTSWDRDTGVLHWRLAWNAYPPNSETPAGHKVLEVKTASITGENTTQPVAFKFRYSFRSNDSKSTRTWRVYELGELGEEDRQTLVGFARTWGAEQGNCITCVREAIEKMVDLSAFGDKAKFVLLIIQGVINSETEVDERFAVTHRLANDALVASRAVYLEGNGLAMRSLRQIHY